MLGAVGYSPVVSPHRIKLKCGVVYAGKVAYDYKGEMPANTNLVLEEGTKGITEDAFEGCTSLTSITIPDSVTSIGDKAFEDWTSSQTIYIKGRSEAPTGWSDYWEYSCDAQIVWNA